MHHLHNKLFFVFFLLLPSIVLALPDDREQAIEIEADHAQLDDTQGITQYKGDAILTQGSLKITGDIITFYYDENKELTKAVATGTKGNLATYQQIRNPGEKPVRARAVQMEYYESSQEIHLIEQAYVWQDGNEFSGNNIKYDIAKNIVNIKSVPVKKDADGKTSPKERVHIIIQPPSSRNKKSTNTPKLSVPSPTNTTQEATPTTETAPEEKQYPTAVTTSKLNVRSGPGTQYNTLGTFEIHEQLIILTEQKDWVQVRGMIDNQAVVGWVFRRYVSIN